MIDGGRCLSGAPLVSVQDVWFGYQAERDILRGVSLEVKAGSCLCLMGANGCGKSTLLDCLLGEHAIAQGEIEIQGRALAGLSSRELARLAAYVPQIHERSFPYDVHHIVMMGRTPYLGLTGVPNGEDERRVDEALSACGIAHLEDRPCTALSGGEMQMALLARALVQETSLVVMDEPTVHLDMRNELVFLEAVERLVADEGATVLMATHAPNQSFLLEAHGIPVEVAVMEDGAIAAQGRPHEVLTEGVLQRAFGVEAQVWARGEQRWIVPLAAAGTASNAEMSRETAFEDAIRVDAAGGEERHG